MEFVNETMRTGQIQSIITRVEMVAQDLIQTASGNDAQRLKRSMRAFKSKNLLQKTPRLKAQTF